MLVETSMIHVPELKPDIVLVNGFTPHRGFAGTGYRLEPIHRNQSAIDYKAWHDESWNELRVLFGRAWDWPRAMSEAQNADDLEFKHYVPFLQLKWISYEILSADGARALGSVYISPEGCGSFGATATYWITTPLRAEYESVVHAELHLWLNTVWPWGATYFPGPEMSDVDRALAYARMEENICP